MKINGYTQIKYPVSNPNFCAKNNPKSSNDDFSEEDKLQLYSTFPLIRGVSSGKFRSFLFAAMFGAEIDLSETTSDEISKEEEACLEKYKDILIKYPKSKKLEEALKIYTPDFKSVYMQGVINSQDKNGQPLFSADNLAGIIQGESTIKTDISNEQTIEYVFNNFILNLKSCNPREKDFLCEHFNKCYMYDINIIKNLLSHKIFQDGKENELVKFIISQNEQVQDFLFLEDNIPTIESINDYIRISDFYKSYIETVISEYFNEISKMNVSDNVKTGLYINTACINKTLLKNTVNFINSLPQEKLAQCKDEILICIIGICSEKFLQNSPEHNLALASNLKTIYTNMNKTEHELFDKKIKEKYKEVIKLINKDSNILYNSTQNIKPFFKSFIYNAEKINGKTADSILTSVQMDKYLEERGQSGIELAFPKKEFVKKLYNKIYSLDDVKENEIQEKLGIKLTNFPVGYNGIITDKNLDENDKDEKEIKELIQDFFYNNKVVAKDSDIAEVLTILIKAFPEFLNAVGKIQHKTHKYSIDIHTLKVLTHALKDKDYKKLNKQEQMFTKMAILFHDIGKNQGVVDDEHPAKSAEIMADILSKVNLSFENKNRIIELIRNHHWYKAVNLNGSKEILQNIATMFRRENDLTIAKIICAADINSINDNFAQYIGYNQLPHIVSKIKVLQEKLHSLGSFNYSTKICPNMFKEQALTDYTRDGITHKLSVLNFSETPAPKEIGGLYIPDNKNLLSLGFINDSTKPVYKKDLSFLVHCTDLPLSIYTINKLGSDMNICSSSVTLNKMATYINLPFGFVFDTPEQINVGASSENNQGSGYHKNIEHFSQEIWKYADERINYQFEDGTPANFKRKAFCEYLKNIGVDISRTEYAQIHKFLTKRNFLSQIKDLHLSTGKILNADDIKEAIKYSDEKIRKNYNYNHNEINLYTPKVIGIFARKNTLDEIPLKYILAAEELNMPIFLFGNPQITKN